jgi:hypothetical protein
MFSIKRIATLAAITAAAIIPAVGAQAANARPSPPERTDAVIHPCVAKWILAPPHADDGEEGSTFDTVEHQASGTEHDESGMGTIQDDASGGSGFETVEHDDYSYSGC